jgi:hypothetical protein
MPEVSEGRIPSIFTVKDPAGFLLGILFDPDVGGDIFVRNVGHSPNYTALQPRNPFSIARMLRAYVF